MDKTSKEILIDIKAILLSFGLIAISEEDTEQLNNTSEALVRYVYESLIKVKIENIILSDSDYVSEELFELFEKAFTDLNTLKRN